MSAARSKKTGSAPSTSTTAAHTSTSTLTTTASNNNIVATLPVTPASPTDAKFAPYVNGSTQSMDGRQTDFQQPGLSPPYQSYNEPESEGSPAEQASAAQFPQAQQDNRQQNFSPAATPTSEYTVNPSSARSGTFPEYVQRPYAEGQQRFHPPSGQGANAGGMAQAPSPSMPLPDGQANSHNESNVKSDPDVPIDPSIAAQTSPTYAPASQFSPYPPQHDMAHYPPHSGTPGIYQRPEWAAGNYPPQPAPPHMYGHPAGTSGPNPPAMVSPVPRPPAGGHPLSTVYSFVPIPGAQQHKRPRRRYEEIERMYKCGWNGCEKAYGTLNHLNAHVTMQSHGTKRTPEEFKEIRKEWKAKKKEEEAQRKADEERQRQSDGRVGPDGAPEAQGVYGQLRAHMGPPPSMGAPAAQLPPIGYTAAPTGQAPPQYSPQSAGIEGMAQYANNQMYNNSNNNGAGGGNFPQSPYGPGNAMYQQHSEQSSNNFQQ